MAERVALVTGGSSGIGLAVARALGKDGYGITLSARQPEKPRPRLDDDALHTIRSLRRVKEVYPNFRFPVVLKYERFAEPFTATGVPMSARGEGTFQTIAFGTFFANESDEACMLTLDTAGRAWYLAPLPSGAIGFAYASADGVTAGETVPGPAFTVSFNALAPFSMAAVSLSTSPATAVEVSSTFCASKPVFSMRPTMGSAMAMAICKRAFRPSLISTIRSSSAPRLM